MAAIDSASKYKKRRARIAEDKRLAKLVRKGGKPWAIAPLKPKARRSQEKIKTSPEMERAFKIIGSDRYPSGSKIHFAEEGYTYPYDHRTKVHPGEPRNLRTRKHAPSGFSFRTKLDDAATGNTRSKDHVVEDARLKMLAREEAIARKADYFGAGAMSRERESRIARERARTKKQKAKATQKRNPNR